MKNTPSDADRLDEHNADLWAMFYGFDDAGDLMVWGAQKERELVSEKPTKMKGVE